MNSNEDMEGGDYGFEATTARMHGTMFIWRVRRFCATMLGFHTGVLDLTGRHEYRYASLSRRWVDWVVDLLDLEKHSIRHERQVEPEPWERMLGQDEVATEVTFDTPSDIASKFLEKWKIPNESFDLEWLLPKVMVLIKENPRPKLQRLCLAHLPPELIHRVMYLGGVDVARRLGATSSFFHQIALPHAFKWRTFTLTSISSSRGAPEDLVTLTAARCREIIDRARRHLMDNISFTLSHPQILQSIEHISVHRGWDAELMFETAIDDIHQAAEFWRPVLEMVAELVTACPKLKKFSASGIVLQGQALDSLSSAAKLRGVELRACIPILLPQSQPIQRCRALNVYLGMSESEQWELLAYFPDIRVLSVRGSLERPIQVTEPAIVFRIPLFKHLQRLCLMRLDNDHVTTVAEWLMLQSEAYNGLQLTHVKIRTALGMYRHEVLHLVRALHSAPLQVLYLEGLDYIGAELFESLALSTPNVEALTLIYRDGRLQRTLKPANWPCTTWELASWLSQLGRLQHFGCNLRIPYYEPTTLNLLYMELGFPETLPGDDGFSNPERDRVFKQEETGATVARLFAVHAPNLQTVLFSHGEREYDVRRKGSRVWAQARRPYSGWEEVEEYDPDDGWDTIASPEDN
ncbi:hypothetical protein PUNSTDRAFT_142031 [Punctularia strigosozonata HHB-11173 SS5]|uniref:uncharacterized protein n=1 Tax=Punctularia strigosozonata (strain HHB-11173) TaxID=741275 RepID=UPI0004417A4B|nr:uncharacterized protein PUNSTDRAFT_142031 [Punctularia strigosozonata HHB-11173 SS5]EIN11777.1 hypothetical protein PUNSTDRAFT_142031 [Punctularia strigosozonata HHB-11173 SS5]